jgi:hypothetical protein
MTICVHALYIAHVVTLLPDIRRAASRARACQASSQQASACANGSPRSATDRRPRRSAQPGSYGRACYAARGGGLVWRGPAGLLKRELPALVIIGAKLLETLARARQNHYART